MNNIDPPPSLADLVSLIGEKPTNNHQWLTWFNNLYEYLNVTLKSGYISEKNSSTTAINTGSNFTGEWEDVGDYDSLTVAVKTDQNGYFTVEFSPDATNTDSTLTRYYNIPDSYVHPNEIEAPHRYAITRKYARVRFYNDSGTNQTYFRLQTSIGQKAPLNVPIDGKISVDYDATVVRPTDHRQEIALGLRQGWTLWNKFGYNLTVPNSTTPEVVASWSATWSPTTSGAETLSVVSTSAADDLGSTGAEIILIIGIDSNYEPIEEYVTLNGTSAVTTTASFIGINRMYAVQFGTGNENAGAINITGSSSGDTYGQIPAQSNVSQQCIFYTPIGHTFLADWVWINVRKLSGGGGTPRVTVYGYSYSYVTGAKYEVFRCKIDTGVDNVISIEPPSPFPIGGKEVFYLECESDTANTAVTARFSGNLVRAAST